MRKANAIFDVLYGESPFAVADVLELEPEEPYDVVLCCGGLYHLHDPASLLAACLDWTREYLVVQTVVSLDHEGEDGLLRGPGAGAVAAAAGSAHSGSRRMLEEAGWEIARLAPEPQPGCAEQRDAGSIFALCRPGSRV